MIFPDVTGCLTTKYLFYLLKKNSIHSKPFCLAYAAITQTDISFRKGHGQNERNDSQKCLSYLADEFSSI